MKKILFFIAAFFAVQSTTNAQNLVTKQATIAYYKTFELPTEVTISQEVLFWSVSEMDGEIVAVPFNKNRRPIPENRVEGRLIKNPFNTSKTDKIAVHTNHGTYLFQDRTNEL